MRRLLNHSTSQYYNHSAFALTMTKAEQYANHPTILPGWKRRSNNLPSPYLASVTSP